LRYKVSKDFRRLRPIPTGMRARGSISKPLTGIVFDVYGTLFISESGDISLSRNLKRRIKPLRNLLDRYHIRRPVHTVLNAYFETIQKCHSSLRSKGIDFPEVEIDDIWREVLKTDGVKCIREFAVEFELIVNPVYPMPNLKALLCNCKEKNLLMGIVSNAQFFTPLLFKWFLGADTAHLGFHPDLTLYSYQLGYAKPSVNMFKLAAERAVKFGASPDSVLYVGNDMLNDIYPAAQSGFKTALFAGDKRSLRLRRDDPRCRNLSPTLVITDLIQLLDYI